MNNAAEPKPTRSSSELIELAKTIDLSKADERFLYEILEMYITPGRTEVRNLCGINVAAFLELERRRKKRNLKVGGIVGGTLALVAGLLLHNCNGPKNHTGINGELKKDIPSALILNTSQDDSGEKQITGQ